MSSEFSKLSDAIINVPETAFGRHQRLMSPIRELKSKVDQLWALTEFCKNDDTIKPFTETMLVEIDETITRLRKMKP